MELKLAKSCDAKRVYEIVQETVKEIYPKYYLREIVDMFCEFHNEENIVDFREAGYTYIQEDENVLKVAEETETYGETKK